MADIAQKTSAVNAPEVIAYREGFYNLVWVVKILAFIITVLTAVLFYYVSNVLPEDRYYALTGVDGEVKMPMVAMPTPNVTNDALLAWAMQAATDVMTFGFHDMDERFAKSRQYFSDEGWLSFGVAFAKSAFYDNVVKSQQIVTAIPRGTPEILYSGLYKGQFQWILDVPMLMTIRAGGKQRVERTSVRMYIVRMPTQNNPMGIGINTWRQM